MTSNTRHWAIIPAAGIGKRFGADTPKQYTSLLNHTILETTLSVFIENNDIEKIIVAVNPDDSIWWKLGIAHHPKIIVCYGGADRIHSVNAGLDKLHELAIADNDWVLVHDAVRPCLSQSLLNQLFADLRDEAVGGLLATPVRDTLKKVIAGHVEKTVSRESIWCAQTPQMFRYKILRQAIDVCIADDVIGTDEAMAVERLGLNPKIIMGSPDNLKITYPEDLIMAKRVLSQQAGFRIGHGYDVHPFTRDQPLIMGGIEIDYEFGLKGHSDADVVLHALCDALLGALALGDIGKFYPDTQAENADRDSKEFLSEVYQCVQAQGYQLVNVDITILAQAPKLAPYIEKMRECISSICAVEINQVSVKATTTEKLGYIGRKEGVAAEAVVLIAAS